MKKIVFFNKTLISGGIEKCIEALSKEIYKDYELEVCYIDDSIVDINIINLLSNYAKITKIEDDSSIDCDLCIWSYLYFDYKKLKNIIHAKEYICWIHSMPRILPDCLLDNEDFVNDNTHFICVSEAVKNNLNISKEGEVIHNFIVGNIKEQADQEENPFKGIKEDTLKLSVVSRLSQGKGFDRLYKLVCALDYNNIKYNLKIVGKGRKREIEIKEQFSKFTNVEFVGYKENPYPYFKNSDYLIQLSDDESWCNSITEAKILGTPVVVTNFLSSYEQVSDGVNGIQVDLNENDYTKIVKRMLNEKETVTNNLKDFSYNNELDKWLNIIN